LGNEQALDCRGYLLIGKVLQLNRPARTLRRTRTAPLAGGRFDVRNAVLHARHAVGAHSHACQTGRTPIGIDLRHRAAGDQDVWVRRSAMEALARGGITKDKEILLKAALNVMAAPDTGWAAKRFAMGVLQRDGKQYKEAIPVYVKILDNPPEGMWDGTPAVVELLTGMGAADKAVAPLIKMLDPTRRHIPRKAADALAKLGPVAKPAIPALKVLAEKAIDKGAKEAALKAIEKIEASK